MGEHLLKLFTFNWSINDYRSILASLEAMGLNRIYLYFPHRRFNNGRNRGSIPEGEVMVYRRLNGIKVNDYCAHVDLGQWEEWFEWTCQRSTTHGDF